MGNIIVGKGERVKTKFFAIVPVAFLVTYYLRQVMLYFNMSGYVVGDLGRELYAPLRVLQGQIIYKDFFWLYGPWSIWVNALLYRLFSVNSQILYYQSLILGLVIAILVYRLSRLFTSQIVSLLVTMIYIKVTMFGFTWQSLIMPGKFAASWGMLFSLVFLNYLVKKIMVNGAPSRIWLGVIAGMAVITKIDYALAIITCSLMGIVILGRRNDILPGMLAVLRVIAVVMAPVALWMFLYQVSFNDVASNIFPVYASKYWFSHRNFYDFQALFKTLKTELILIIATSFLIAKRLGKFQHLFILKVVTAILTIFILKDQNTGLFKFGFMWPFFILSAGVVVLNVVNQYVPQRIKWALILLSLFNFLLTLRDKLAVGSMSMIFPFLVVIGGLTAIYKYSAGRVSFNYRAGVILLALLLIRLAGDQSAFLDSSQYSDKKSFVTSSRGSFIVEPVPGGIMFDAVNYLSKNRGPGDKMVSFPMEAAIPFFTQIENPLPYDQFANGLIRPADQKNVVNLLNQYKPRFITVSNYEFLGYFGLDYNEEIYEWIVSNYKETAKFGCQIPYDKEVNCTGYGIRIFELKNVKV